jgi:hypothetical protein
VKRVEIVTVIANERESIWDLFVMLVKSSGVAFCLALALLAAIPALLLHPIGY